MSLHANRHGLAISGHMVGSFQDMDMTEAKNLAASSFLLNDTRANRITLHQALDLVAVKLGFAN
ncbi:hypothetical protein ACOJBO_02120 [Rhizobium beringeri]